MSTKATIWMCALGLVLGCGSKDETLTSDSPITEDDDSPAVDASAGPGKLDGGKKPTEAPGPVTSNPSGTKDGGVNVCTSFTVPSRRVIPDMLIVLDRSGSMEPDGNDQNSDRWGGSVAAIVEVTKSLDDKVRFGLMTFPAFTMESGDDDDDDDECTPGTVNVPIGAKTGAAIETALGGMDADGRTPTAASLQAALKVVGEAPPADSMLPPRYVLLVTDGDPNCSGMGARNGPDLPARMQSVAAIDALNKADVKTFVVGYQTAGTEFEQVLDMMAAAGGTGEAKHRSVQNGADLAAVFEQLAGEVASCSFELDKPVDDARYVSVVVGNTARALNNAADGWTLAQNSTTVELVGAACDAVKGGATLKIQIECTEVPVF